MPNGDTQVEVYSPKGEYGTIPSNQMAQALAQGYKPKDSYVEAIHPTTGATGIIPKEQWSAAQAQGYMLAPTQQAGQQQAARNQQTAQGMQPSFFGGAYGTTAQNQYVKERMPLVAGRVADIRKAALALGGASLGAGAVAEGGAGLLPAGMRILGAGAGGVAGNLAGSAISGQVPGAAETAKVGRAMMAGQAGGEALGAVGKFGAKQVAKLFGETPERIAELKALPQTEEAIRQRVVQAEAQSRAGFKSAYDSAGIDAAPVNMAATKNLAQKAADNIVSARIPAPISRVAAIPEPPQNVLTSDDPATILKELAGFDNIPFRQAQLYRTAIEKFISRAGGKLPSDVYGQLKAVSGSLTDGLRETATREGKLAEFQTGETLFKQHAADFWSKGAPLKPFLDVQPNATGATLNRFMQVANQGRALDALGRRGVATDDLRQILAKGSKGVKADIRDAATVKNLGEGVLNQQVATANRAVVKKAAIKAGAGAIGVGSLAELLRQLGSKGSTPTP